MIAYLTNDRFWLHWEGNIGYVSWQVKIIFLTPDHDLIHECIWDWTQKWDQALMMSTLWPNNHQGIYCYVTWWGGGTIPLSWSQLEGKKLKVYLMALKGVESETFTFTVFWVWWSDHQPPSDGLTVFHQRAQNIGYAWDQPS